MPRKRESTLARISVRGFKSIRDEQQIEVRPLTVLAGANSSGKSSIMQPLLLLKQTLEAPGDPGALLLDGPNVRFTQADQLLCQFVGRDRPTEFVVKLELNDAETLEVVFKRERGVGFEVASMFYTDRRWTGRILPGMGHDEIVRVLPTPWKAIHAGMAKREKEKMQWTVYRERCFLAFELRSVRAEGPRVSFGPFGISPSADFVPHLLELIHLPGLRGNPRRTYAKTAAGPLFPGTFESYVASVISQWQASNDDRLSLLGKALEGMGLTWKVKAEPVGDTQVELRVGRLVHSRRGGAHDLVSIADVGFGVSQSLPVVVALIAARPGRVVYLEQPETHLHPRAQRRLAHLLSDAAKKGVVVIVETHSALLLREIQTLVARGDLDKGIVKLHWVERIEDGSTKIEPADLDEKGAYGAWPEDFDEVELGAEKDYLDAVEVGGPTA